MITNYQDLFSKNYVLSCDTECFPDYWNFIFKRIGKPLQFKNLNIPQLSYDSEKQVYIFECWNDEDCRQFSNFYNQFILKSDATMYFYNSTGYDKPMINVMLNLVANKETGILLKLRKMNDYIIKYKLNYKLFTQNYWQNFFKDDRKYIDEKELFEKFNKPVYQNFYNDYKDCIRNRVTKTFDSNTRKMKNSGRVLDLQAIAGFQPGETKTDSEGTSLSLKQLQLLHEGHNQKFDFNKYGTMEEVKAAGLYDTFISYSKRDVTSLEKMFYIYIEDSVKNRFYAIKAVKDSNLKDVDYNTNWIFAESDTKLIDNLLGLDKQEKVDINYFDYINTDIPEFNEFIDFCNRNKGTHNDTTLKKKYYDETGNKEVTFTLNGCEVKAGFGGAHGAIPNYKNFSGNLWLFDYASQYPSIIIEHKDIFSKIMNVDLYHEIYKMRLKFKKLAKDKTLSEDERATYKALEKGLKLILNSTFGLINSEFKIKLANKPLGRFICFKGQSLIYNLCSNYPELTAPNINTDGVYFETDDKNLLKKIISEDFYFNGEGFFKLDASKINWIIQNNVNNYIAMPEGADEVKSKGGAFNKGIKHKFNKNSDLDINVINALKLIDNKPIEIDPIYFKGMKNINCDKAHYLTNKDNGINPINNLKYPVKLSIENNDIYVTDNREKADIEEYVKFAKLTRERLENFRNTVSNVKYYEHILTADTNENNKYFRQNINRIKKLLDCDIKQIGYSGFCGNMKAYTFINGKPINPLINYKKTEIRDSVESKGIVIDNSDNLIIVDIDIFDKNTNTFKHGYPKELVDQLSKIETYKTWNNKTKDFKNFKLIFKNDINKVLDISKDYKDYIEVLDTAVIWSMDNIDRVYYDNNLPVLPISQYNELLENVLTVKFENATEHKEKKEEREKKSNIIETESNDIVINAALDILKGNDVDIFNVITDEQGTHIHTSCPYCSTLKNKHYNNNFGTVDAYVNINEISTGYKLNIINLSKSCNDSDHKKHYKEMNEIFKQSLPSKSEIENTKLFQELKDCVDIEYSKNFFLKDTVKIVGTGGGKTHQAAAKLAYNLFHNEIFTIVTTKQNSNIEDFEKTFKKIVKLSLKKSTKRIDNWLESPAAGFKELKIHKLKNQTGISEDRIGQLRAVVTNHKYFYNIGHLATYNGNMQAVKQARGNKPLEIIVDEYESFKEMGLMIIKLNNFLYWKKDIDTNEKIFIPASSAFYPCVKKCRNEKQIFEHAKLNTRVTMDDNEGIQTYKLDQYGEKDLYKELHEFCEPYGPPKYDCGRRKPKKIHKNTNLCYIVCDKIQQYKLKEKPDIEGKNNFRDVLYKNEHIAVVTQVLKVSTAYVEDFDINIWGEEIGSIEELMFFGLDENNKLSEPEFGKFKDCLFNEAKELFINHLSISIKSMLDKFNCPKYYLTANVIKDNYLQIDTELAHVSSKSIKKIDVAVMDRDNNNDKHIIDNLDLLENVDFKTLTFLGLSSHIKSIINQKTNINTNHIVIKSVVNDGEKTVNVDTNQSEDIDDSIIKTTTLAYVNGTESQGRNYSKSELLIINGVVDINVKGRLSVNAEGDIIIKSIEEAAKEKLKQSFGRIFRGDSEYKAILVMGDYGFIKEIFDEYGELYTIKFEVVKYNKSIDRLTNIRKGMSDIIEYFGANFAKYNTIYDCEGRVIEREQREIPYFNSDLRKASNIDNKRNTKVDGQDVYNFYQELIDKFYDDFGKKPKDTQLIPEILEKYNISDRQFKTIKKKYKEK